MPHDLGSLQLTQGTGHGLSEDFMNILLSSLLIIALYKSVDLPGEAQILTAAREKPENVTTSSKEQ